MLTQQYNCLDLVTTKAHYTHTLLCDSHVDPWDLHLTAQVLEEVVQACLIPLTALMALSVQTLCCAQSSVQHHRKVKFLRLGFRA